MDIYVFIPGEMTTRLIDYPVPVRPEFEWFKTFLEPYFKNAHFEHVNVLFDGRHTDMFVDEIGLLRGLPINPQATEIYRADAIARYPKINPNSLPIIVGPAVVFAKKVWF